MWLLIDDGRDLGCEVIARRPDIAKKIMQSQKGEFDCIAFDHDLGCRETGLDVLRYAIVNNLLPSRIQLVTSNPVGRNNMKAELLACGFVTKDNVNFYRGNNNVQGNCQTPRFNIGENDNDHQRP